MAWSISFGNLYNYCGSDRSASGTAASLRCPRCLGDHLKHTCVTVYDRHEDAELTLVTIASGRATSTASVLPSSWARNPSARGEGVAIAFTCDQCGDGIELVISQHGRVTFMGWRAAAGAPDPPR
jgi:hypothetical protein